MLIWLEPEVAAPDRGPRHQHGLKELARAIRYGQHVVIGAPGTLRALAQDKDLDQSDRGQFGWMATQIQDLAPLRESVAARIVVEAGGGTPRETTAEKQTVWRVGIDWLGDGEAHVARARLFVEASDDAALYHLLANTLGPAQARPAQGLGAAFHFVSLGGGNAGAIWLQAAEGSPAFGVVDSDRTAPGGPVGSTAQSAKQADQSLPAKACPRALYVLDAHEAENLLPIALIREATTGEAHEGASRCAGGPFVDRKAAIAKDLLGLVLEHLRSLSPGKQREALRGTCTQTDRALPGLLYAWGLAFAQGAAAGAGRG